VRLGGWAIGYEGCVGYYDVLVRPKLRKLIEEGTTSDGRADIYPNVYYIFIRYIYIKMRLR